MNFWHWPHGRFSGSQDEYVVWLEINTNLLEWNPLFKYTFFSLRVYLEFLISAWFSNPISDLFNIIHHSYKLWIYSHFTEVESQKILNLENVNAARSKYISFPRELERLGFLRGARCAAPFAFIFISIKKSRTAQSIWKSQPLMGTSIYARANQRKARTDVKAGARRVNKTHRRAKFAFVSRD